MLLRQIAASNNSTSAEALYVLIPSQVNTTEELLDFDEKLNDVEFRKKMVTTLCRLVFVHFFHKKLRLRYDRAMLVIQN
jgi:hypothetical protein